MKLNSLIRPGVNRALLLASVCAFAIPTLATAQTAPVETAPAQADISDGTVVVVTAFRREQSVMKVPAAISVLSGNELKTQGVNNVSDLQNLVPNVNISNTRDGVTVAMRGVVTTDTSSKGEQDVAFNVDGVYIGRGNARGAAFFDVDRVEVLRGPQGTLYGRSSTGGAINVITNAPKLGDTSGYVKVEYGNYNAKRAEGAVNLPLGDKVAIRIAGNFNDREGYSKSIAYSPVFNGTTYNFPASSAPARNDQKDATGRVSLLFKPNDDAKLRLTATVGHQGGVGSAPALETQLQAHNDSGDGGLDVLANPVHAFVDSDFQMIDGSFNVKFGGLQLDLLASYQDLDFKQQGTSVQDANANGGGVISPTFQLPPTPTFGPTFQFYLQKNRVKTTQYEARLSNAGAGTFEYVVGANYFKEEAGENGQGWNALISNPLDESTYIFQAGPVNLTTHEAYGVFGQATWHATAQLGVVAGVRYTHDETARIGRFALPFNFAAGFPPPPYPDSNGDPICHYPDTCLGDVNNGGADDSKVTWKLGVNYQATPSDLFYASVSTGFKGGGFNDYDPATGGIGQYDPSSITAYEIGYKGRPLTGLTVSSSLFYYDFSADQITSGVTFPNGQYVIFTQTTPTKISGWENEATWRVTRNTSFSGSASFLHSEFVNFQAGSNAFLGNGIDLSGKPLDQAPEFVATLAFNQTFDIGNDAQLKLRIASKYSDSYLVSDFADGVRYTQPSFTRSDASLTYEAPDDKYSIQLFVENIENKVQRTGGLLGYQNTGPYGGSGVTTFTGLPANYLAFSTSTPRFYGVRLGVKF